MSGFENKKIENKSVDYSRVVVNSDNVGVYSNSVISSDGVEDVNLIQEVFPYNFVGPLAPGQQRVEAPSLNNPRDDWMFGETETSNGQFGGDQGALTYNANKWLKDKKVRKIIDKYYPDATEEDIELLFFRMNRVGCGYISVINMIMYATKDMPDYQEKFGFQQYTLGFKDSGEPYRDYNYEYLFLDYFLYFAKNREGYETIEDVYGNAAEEREYVNDQDAATDPNKFPQTGMDGIGPPSHASLIEKYLAEKGIKFKKEDTIEIEQGSFDWKEKRKELEGKGITINDDEHLYYSGNELTKEMIEDIINSGKFLTVSSPSSFNLYYPYDKDGNGFYDDVASADVGEHAMFVVGTTSDPTKVIVSSWGQEYIMDIADFRQYGIFSFEV